MVARTRPQVWVSEPVMLGSETRRMRRRRRARQSRRTIRAQFTDWCAAIGPRGLPAEPLPSTSMEFLADVPCGAEKGVAAIDHRCTSAGHQSPGPIVSGVDR
jgi:hypothetical protein